MRPLEGLDVLSLTTIRRLLVLALVSAAAAPCLAEELAPAVLSLHRNPNDLERLWLHGGGLAGRTRSGLELAIAEKDLEDAVGGGGATLRWRPLRQGGEGAEPRLPGPTVDPFGRTRRHSMAGFEVTAAASYNGGSYLATFGGGLYREDGMRVAGSPSDIRDLAVLDGGGKRLLVLGSGDGLALYDGEELRTLRLPGPPNDNVSALAWGGGSLWVGYFDGGLARHKAGRWETVPTPGAPGASWINTLAWDGKTLWVGSAAGLGRWHSGVGSVEKVEGFNGKVQSLRCQGETVVVAGGDAVWVGREESWERIDLPGEALHAALLRGATLWAAGMRGVLKRQGEKWHRYSELNGRLPDSWVTALLPVDNQVWAGTYDAGLLALSGETRAKVVRPGVWVNPNALARVDGGIAVGTLGDGLLLYDEGDDRWRRLTTAEGLPSNDVTAVLMAAGSLWVGTRSGLVELAVDHGPPGHPSE